MSDNPCATSEKEEIRRYWAERAPFWEQQAETVTEMADRFNQPLLDSVDIGPGHRVLDLASGAGEPALTIARRVSPEGSVTATDLVDDMLAGARRRADAARLDNIRFRQADMENLPFPDQSFDRLTCRFGHHVRAVTRPGSRRGASCARTRRPRRLYGLGPNRGHDAPARIPGRYQ